MEFSEVNKINGPLHDFIDNAADCIRRPFQFVEPYIDLSRYIYISIFISIFYKYFKTTSLISGIPMNIVDRKAEGECGGVFKGPIGNKKAKNGL